jgi:hypothetical protein
MAASQGAGILVFTHDRSRAWRPRRMDSNICEERYGEDPFNTDLDLDVNLSKADRYRRSSSCRTRISAESVNSRIAPFGFKMAC